MSRLLSHFAAAGDQVNPIVVKEFRQAVQSRLVIAVLILSLLINLVVVGGYVMFSPDADTSMQGGQTVFMALDHSAPHPLDLRAALCGRSALPRRARRREHRPIVRHHDHARGHHSRQYLAAMALTL